MGAGPIRALETLDPVPARDQTMGSHPQTAATPEAKQPIPSINVAEEIKTHWDVDNGVVVEITNQQSGELIRQIPSQQVLNVAHYIEQYLLQESSSEENAQVHRERE